jgi:5'-nucleotidase
MKLTTNRRNFVRTLSLGGMYVMAGKFPAYAAVDDVDLVKIVILHTNDVHSRVEPFPMDGSRNQGKAGVAKRAVLIDKVRAANEHVLLLDAGDIFQGTPYFNFYGGEVEIKLMSAMKYDAGTIGNHDFDGGMDGLLKQLPHATFPLLNSNYDFSDTILNGKIEDYRIFNKGGIKIGVFGVGIELEGLVPSKLYLNTIYNDPIKSAQKTSSFLKNEMGCDYVICLSHLGFKYEENKVSDHTLAAETEFIDLIIGGHTHTFLQEAITLPNKIQKPVIVNQVGFAGIMLGQLDVVFERNKKGKCTTCSNTTVG